MGFLKWLSGKESAYNVDRGSFPGSGRSPGGGHDIQLQQFCLENPMDSGGWWATVQRVIKGLVCVGHDCSNEHAQRN